MPSQGTSRLDKLLQLLESAKLPENRKAAASQISGICKSHPQQLPFILRKLHIKLYNRRWETRTAAGTALGLIAEHFRHPSVADLEAAAQSGSDGVKQEDPHVSFDGLDLEQILQRGTPLVGSAGLEYDVKQALSGPERIRRQRKVLRERLGLEEAGAFVESEELMQEEDLVAVAPVKQEGKRDAADLLTTMGGLSARERNKLKRKAKQTDRSAAAKSSAKGGDAGGTANATGNTPAADLLAGADPELVAKELAEEWREIVEDGVWPFQNLCDQLVVDVLDLNWEVRHGAAVALREVLSTHAASAGVQLPAAAAAAAWTAPAGSGAQVLAGIAPDAAAAAAAANLQWLEDGIVMLVCVLALDRFGDYVTDQVVAPVRETAAQALGTAVQPLPTPAVLALLGKLGQQLQSSLWEVRHGGMLGLKYILAARKDLSHLLVPHALPVLMQGLQDQDDDVCAATADSLVPVADTLAAQGTEAVLQVRRRLWDILDDVDELSPATGSAMVLLAHLYRSCPPEGSAAAMAELAQLAPRLWPFMRHGSAAVRLASVRCLASLLQLQRGSGDGPDSWWFAQPELVQAALRLVFQNLLLEGREEVLVESERVWRTVLQAAPTPVLVDAASPPLLAALFNLASTPTGSQLELEEMLYMPLRQRMYADGEQPEGVQVSAKLESRRRKRRRTNKQGKAAAAGVAQHPLYHVVGGLGEGSERRAQLLAAAALGRLAARLSGTAAVAALAKNTARLLASGFFTSKLLGSLVLSHWLLSNQPTDGAGSGPPSSNSPAGPDGETAVPDARSAQQELVGKVYAQLEGVGRDDGDGMRAQELQPVVRRMRCDLGHLVASQQAAGGQLPGWEGRELDALSVPEALAVLAACQATTCKSEELSVDWHRANDSALQAQAQEASLSGTVQAALACAAVHWCRLPSKLNTLIKPLMAAVRREAASCLQEEFAKAICQLIVLCIDRSPSPNPKILKNLSVMACSDASETPSADAEDPDSDDDAAAEQLLTRQPSQPVGQDSQATSAGSANTRAREGAEMALKQLCAQLQGQLFERLPQLWEALAAPLQLLQSGVEEGMAAGPIIHALQLLKVVGPSVHASLLPRVLSLQPALCAACKHPRPGVREAAGRSAARLARAEPQRFLPPLLALVLPLLAQPGRQARQGAAVLLQELVAGLPVAIVPFSVLLAVPLMGRMSDPVRGIRRAATHCFASVVALLPLAMGMPPPQGLSDEQQAACVRDRVFLEQLLDNRRAADTQLPMKLSVELRPYQQEGINWLAFLRRFGLHGVLADDMGLGKTLQATAIVAATTVEQEQAAANAEPAGTVLPSLVVCPSTLVGHWAYEISKFVGEDVLRPLQYQGTVQQRSSLRTHELAGLLNGKAGAGGVPLPYNVVVTSYQSLRADLDWFERVHFSYCILDEGHVIKNASSRLAQACRRVAAQHRLVLSGTPVQNNVMELWSLFDFLMPGFLGSEKLFNARFGKAIQGSRGVKKGSKEAEAAVVAMEQLHKTVMPFVLRRTKEQVLQDLPPKIIQDILVDPSPIQQRLFQDFASSEANSQLLSRVESSSAAGKAAAKTANGAAPHVFKALQYLRKLCSHPLLVLDWSQPEHVRAVADVLGGSAAGSEAAARAALRAAAHAPKLEALQQLLADCGIAGCSGGEADAEAELSAAAGSGAGQHRLLVFAQLKSVLDLVESEVLRPAGVSFLRLDGGLPPAERFKVVQQFNADPTIDVLLLTTHIGGLGLNLTSADTVVFMEHDWNPANDLQAMDRAHRLGQKRTVNVYRLLVRTSIEERVMSLQQFKLDMAGSIVNADNISLRSMDTSKLLDLFSASAEQQQQQQQQEARKEAGSAASSAADTAVQQNGGGAGWRAVMESVEHLASEHQYAEEFDLGSFMSRASSFRHRRSRS